MSTPFAKQTLSRPAPVSVFGDVTLPRRERYFASPADWRDEVLYFLMVDRFSDGHEAERLLLDRGHRARARPKGADGQDWRWDRWAESGARRWQGGTLKGVRSKLDYLGQLGITALWLSPVFKQRAHLDTFHGYGIQDFLDVDPRFGTRDDLVALVDAAHQRGIRVILDVIFNHSGSNWVYQGGVFEAPFLPFPQFHPFGSWLGRSGEQVGTGVSDREQGVWPRELQVPENYTRAGTGNLGAGSLDDPHAEHKRSDFLSLRDFALDVPNVLSRLIACYEYWIALTDCDGFRIDTLKHVSLDEGRNFCGAIKEFAVNLGKADFFLVGEIAGGDFSQDRYLDVLGNNLNAALDIGEMRLTLNGVAKGLRAPSDYFSGFDPGRAVMGSHRAVGARHVSIVDDHDHVFGEKIRFSSEAASETQVVAAVALQLLTLGIPCIYYGTEQALSGPEASERRFLPGWKGGDHADRYLREAMFGPLHPRAAADGNGSNGAIDQALPGFGPFGTAGAHCFDPAFPTFRAIAALCALRKAFPVLRHGRQYQRQVSVLGGPFAFAGPGELVAWSRILSDEEALCVVNGHGVEARGANVVVDRALSPPGSELVVVANSAQAAGASSPSHPVGSRVRVELGPDGNACVPLRNVPPSGVVLLVNHA